jgi:hypothetical protein
VSVLVDPQVGYRDSELLIREFGLRMIEISEGGVYGLAARYKISLRTVVLEVGDMAGVCRCKASDLGGRGW